MKKKGITTQENKEKASEMKKYEKQTERLRVNVKKKQYVWKYVRKSPWKS